MTAYKQKSLRTSSHLLFLGLAKTQQLSSLSLVNVGQRVPGTARCRHTRIDLTNIAVAECCLQQSCHLNQRLLFPDHNCILRLLLHRFTLPIHRTYISITLSTADGLNVCNPAGGLSCKLRCA